MSHTRFKLPAELLDSSPDQVEHVKELVVRIHQDQLDLGFVPGMLERHLGVNQVVVAAVKDHRRLGRRWVRVVPKGLFEEAVADRSRLVASVMVNGHLAAQLPGLHLLFAEAVGPSPHEIEGGCKQNQRRDEVRPAKRVKRRQVSAQA